MTWEEDGMAFDLQVILSGMMALPTDGKGVMPLLVDTTGNSKPCSEHCHTTNGSHHLVHYPYLRIADANEAEFEDGTSFKKVAEDSNDGYHQVLLKEKWEISFLRNDDSELNGGPVALDEDAVVKIFPPGSEVAVRTQTHILRLENVDQRVSKIYPDFVVKREDLKKKSLALLAARARILAGRIRPFDDDSIAHHRVLEFEWSDDKKYYQRVASHLEWSVKGVESSALKIRLDPLPGNWSRQRTLTVKPLASASPNLVQVGLANEPILEDFCAYCCDIKRLEHTKLYFEMANVATDLPETSIDYTDGFYETIGHACKVWTKSTDEAGKYPVICYSPLVAAQSIGW